MAEAPLQIDIVTNFPRMLDSILGESMLKRAQDAGLVQIRCVNLRDFAAGAHLTTDDRPYGGGPGMVMKPEPVFKAVDALRRPESKVILMTPQGARQPVLLYGDTDAPQRASCRSRETGL